MSELQQQIEFWKTYVYAEGSTLHTVGCKYHASESGCAWGFSCHFHHSGVHRDARLMYNTPPHPRTYRQYPCTYYAEGYCMHGEKCTFIHAEPEKPDEKTVEPEKPDEPEKPVEPETSNSEHQQ